MSMREIIVPKSFEAQRTKAKTAPGRKDRTRCAAIEDPFVRVRPGSEIQFSIFFSIQVSSTWVSVVRGARPAMSRRACGRPLCRSWCVS